MLETVSWASFQSFVSCSERPGAATPTLPRRGVNQTSTTPARRSGATSSENRSETPREPAGQGVPGSGGHPARASSPEPLADEERLRNLGDGLRLLPMLIARVDRPTGPPPNRVHTDSSTARSRRSRPSASTSYRSRQKLTPAGEIRRTPSPTRSRTRRSNRLRSGCRGPRSNHLRALNVDGDTQQCRRPQDDPPGPRTRSSRADLEPEAVTQRAGRSPARVVAPTRTNRISSGIAWRQALYQQPRPPGSPPWPGTASLLPAGQPVDLVEENTSLRQPERSPQGHPRAGSRARQIRNGSSARRR